MKKFFNETRVNELLHTYPCLTKLDIKNSKQSQKKLKKELQKINNITILFNSTKNKNNLIKSFFPLKFEEISNNGTFETVDFFYRSMDDKIVWIVRQNNNERTFKIHTDTYLTKVKNNIQETLKLFKEKTDKIYGYFIEYDALGNWYITDKNFTKEKKYKILAEGKNEFIAIYSKKLGSYSDIKNSITEEEFGNS